MTEELSPSPQNEEFSLPPKKSRKKKIVLWILVIGIFFLWSLRTAFILHYCVETTGEAEKSFIGKICGKSEKHYEEQSIQEFKECIQNGGRGNPGSPISICTPSTKDGGKVCKENSECESFCCSGACYGWKKPLRMKQCECGVCLQI